MKLCKILIPLIGISLCVGCSSQETKNVVKEEPIVSNNELEVEGQVYANKIKEIYLTVPAKIKTVDVLEGEVISKGMPLFTLDMTDYKNEVKLKEMNIAMMEEELNALQQNSNPLTIEIGSLQKELKLRKEYLNNQSDPEISILKNKVIAAEKKLKSMKADYEANKAFYKSGSISEKELNDLKENILEKETEIQNLKTNIGKSVDSIKLEINNLESKIESKQMEVSQEDKNITASIAVKKLKIEIAQEELEELKAKVKNMALKDNQIIAKEEKILVYDIQCVDGMQIGENTQLLAKYIDLNDLMVTINIPIEDLLSVQVGTEVELDIYTDQNAPIKGVVSRISERAVDIDGDSFVKTDVVVNEGVELLKLGAQLDATIHLKN